MLKKFSVFLSIIAGSYAVYALTCIFLAPALLKPFIEEHSQNFIAGTVIFESISFNPFNNSLTVTNIHIKNSSQRNLLAMSELYININLLPFSTQRLHVEQVKLQHVRLFLADTEEKPWLNIPYASGNDISIQLPQKKIVIGSLIVGNPDLHIIASHTGENNVSDFVEQFLPVILPAKDDSEQKTENDSDGWRVVLKQLQLQQGQLLVTDVSLQPAAETRAQDVQISLHNIHSDLSSSIPLTLRTKMLGGSFSLDGYIEPDTLASELNYRFENLQLTAFHPYLNHYTHLLLKSGVLTSTGAIHTKRSEMDLLLVEARNQSRIENLQLLIEGNEKTLLECVAIAHEDLHFSMHDAALNLDNFVFDQCNIHVRLYADASNDFNLLKTIVAEDDQASESSDDASTGNKSPGNKSTDKTKKPTSKATDENAPLALHVSSIHLHNNTIYIEDMTQGAAVSMTVKNLDGSIQQLQKGDNFLSPIVFTAMINDHAPLEIKGTGNFLNPEISLKAEISLNRLGMHGFTPYTLSLGKRPIERGALTLNLNYHLENNIIDGKNSILLENLSMGRRENIEGGSLPLGLAVTILKDHRGNINIDIPIHGNLQDPSFSAQGQVMRTFTNIITRAANAPLNALGGIGNLVRNAEAPAEFIFDAGSAQLGSAYDSKITTLASTLKEHPELGLNIIARSHPSEQTLLAEAATDLSTLARQRAEYLRDKLIALGIISEQLLLSFVVDDENSKAKAVVNIDFFAR